MEEEEEKLEERDLEECDLEERDLEECDLEERDLEECDLEGRELEGDDLEERELEGSELEEENNLILIYMKLLILILIGFLAGAIGAGVGSAGGTIMVAALLILGVITDIKTSVGTVLFSLLPPVSIGAIIKYWQAGQVKWRMGVVLMIANVIGGTVSGFVISKYLSSKSLELIYATFLLLLSFYFYWKTFSAGHRLKN